MCSHGSPQHAITDLITRLDIVRRGSGFLQGTQAVTGVFIDLLSQRLVIQGSPGSGCVLLERVGPAVAIVEIEHELHASRLDARSEHLDSIKVLDDTLSLVGCRSVLGVDKQAHTCRIPTLLLGPRDDVIYDLAIAVVVMGRPDTVA